MSLEGVQESKFFWKTINQTIITVHYCQWGKKNKKNKQKQGKHSPPSAVGGNESARLDHNSFKLTVGVITQSGIQKDTGLVLRRPNHVDSNVQVLNPLPHLHLGAEITHTHTHLK